MVAVALMIPGIPPCNESSARTENVCFPSRYRTAGLTPHPQAAPTNKQHCPHLLGDSFLCQLSHQLFLFIQTVEKQLKWSHSSTTWLLLVCSDLLPYELPSGY